MEKYPEKKPRYPASHCFGWRIVRALWLRVQAHNSEMFPGVDDLYQIVQLVTGGDVKRSTG